MLVIEDDDLFEDKASNLLKEKVNHIVEDEAQSLTEDGAHTWLNTTPIAS